MRVDNIILSSWWLVLIPGIVYFAGLLPLSCACCCCSVCQRDNIDRDSPEHVASQMRSIVNIFVGIFGLIFICLLAAKLDQLDRFSLAVVFIPWFILVGLLALIGCCMICMLNLMSVIIPMEANRSASATEQGHYQASVARDDEETSFAVVPV